LKFCTNSPGFSIGQAFGWFDTPEKTILYRADLILFNKIALIMYNNKKARD